MALAAGVAVVVTGIVGAGVAEAGVAEFDPDEPAVDAAAAMAALTLWADARACAIMEGIIPRVTGDAPAPRMNAGNGIPWLVRPC